MTASRGEERLGGEELGSGGGGGGGGARRRRGHQSSGMAEAEVVYLFTCLLRPAAAADVRRGDAPQHRAAPSGNAPRNCSQLRRNRESFRRSEIRRDIIKISGFNETQLRSAPRHLAASRPLSTSHLVSRRRRLLCLAQARWVSGARKLKPPGGRGGGGYPGKSRSWFRIDGAISSHTCLFCVCDPEHPPQVSWSRFSQSAAARIGTPPPPLALQFENPSYSNSGH